MRAIVLMFDSLNRRFLPPYGAQGIDAPNFDRLAQRTVTFDRCYAGSMPCMPARREMHTGRYNFLHRSWGPLEPFDDSVPEMLRQAGTYTHLITDHQHYWEDGGGGTYHNRFDSYELIRGQEGDRWKGHAPAVGERLEHEPHTALIRQDRINRTYLSDEADHPQTQVFDAGLHFLETNAERDNWMVQIETFDPHEPFFTPERWRAKYPGALDPVGPDWPPYGRVTETPEAIDSTRAQYFALLSMCDASLGRVLDMMDEKSMWDDTMLIVCTDHGYLLGEHGWWAKMVQPFYDEVIHTPFFAWDPRLRVQGERRQALVQTIDIGPTLLDFFGQRPTERMEGRPLADAIANDTPIRQAGLFGAYGMHVCVTDGRRVYMRGPADAANGPLTEYTLMPTHMRWRFAPDELRAATLHAPLPFTRGVPVLAIPGATQLPTRDAVAALPTLLFDLEADPEQERPIADARAEGEMIDLLLDLMRRNHAPAEQFARLGLPATGPAGPEHLRTVEMA